jgi:YVTN family beta-propeller protein
LSLTLTAGAASALTAAPAWAAGGYTLTATIPVGQYPIGVAVSPDGKHAYVANESVPSSVSVIDTATNQVTDTFAIPSSSPLGVAVSPDGTRAYVVSAGNPRVFVIGTATNHVTATIPVGNSQGGVAVSPDGTRAYITHSGYPGSVSVIDTATGHVTATIHRLCSPWGWRSAPAAPTSTSPTPWRGAPYR